MGTGRVIMARIVYAIYVDNGKVREYLDRSSDKNVAKNMATNYERLYPGKRILVIKETEY
jgi:hypothetical protein